MRISLLPNVGSGSQVPSLAKEGRLRHQKDAAKPPSPAQTGWLVPKKIVLESERTTPSAPFIGTFKSTFRGGMSVRPAARSFEAVKPSKNVPDENRELISG